MNIRGYLPTSLLEWPGKISTVVFVGGCNFRCPFCYNRDLVLNPNSLPLILEEEIFEDLKRRKRWIDGVVIGGGEPTIQPDLPGFLKKIKSLGFSAKINTNGSRPAVLKKLFNRHLLDYVAMDIKTSLDRYAQITQSQTQISQIKESIRLIMNSGIGYEFRTTVVPTLHTKRELLAIAKTLRGAKKWLLNQFRPINCLDPKFEKIKPYSKKDMEEILVAVQKYLPGAKLRGV